MPVTPLHCGIGGLAKGIAPSRVSLTAFAFSQLIIDLEPAYFLLKQEWPLHRLTHTFIVAVPLGIYAGLGTWLLARAFGRHLRSSWAHSTELALLPSLIGGLLGGLSHPLLDGIMHSDPVPFWPFRTGNPLAGLIGDGPLQLLCLAAGAAGYILWVERTQAEPCP